MVHSSSFWSGSNQKAESSRCLQMSSTGQVKLVSADVVDWGRPYVEPECEKSRLQMPPKIPQQIIYALLRVEQITCEHV